MVSLYAWFPERYSSPLEGGARGTLRYRFSILFAHPGESVIPGAGGLRLRDGLTVERNASLRALDHWRTRWTFARAKAETTGLFTGGWFIVRGYALAGRVE